MSGDDDSTAASYFDDWHAATISRTSCQDAEGRSTEDEEDHGFQLNTISSRLTDIPLNKLPILVSELVETFGWTPKIKNLLAGVADKDSPLSSLQGFEDSILRKIVSYFAAEYASHIKLTLPAKNTGLIYGNVLCRFESRSEYYGEYTEADDLSTDYVSFASCGTITFPSPDDRNVNMMPFILGDKESLPEYLQCYYDCIKKCPISISEIGSVCYLTVHESYVKAEDTQRRGGLHIETPGRISSSSSPAFTPGREHHWGGGHFYSPDRYEGGVYFASSVANTSVLYNALLDKNVPGLVDEHGSCEHLRGLIGPGTKLNAGQLVWMTDRTPHEALAQEEDGYRQFFRVVTSKVSHWFAQHSTKNAKVPVPDDVIIVEENKFEMLENVV